MTAAFGAEAAPDAGMHGLCDASGGSGAVGERAAPGRVALQRIDLPWAQATGVAPEVTSG